MDANELLEKSLSSVNSVKWEPAWGQSRMESMLESRPDWCISRQRSWGVPIVLLVDKDTGEIHPETQEIIEKVAIMVEKNGIQAWHDVAIEEHPFP